MTTLQSENTVFGYFASETQAETAMRDLKAAGFTRNQISLAGQPGAEMDLRGSANSGSSASVMREDGRKAGAAVGNFWERVKSFFEGGDSAEPYADENTRGDMATHEVTSGGGQVYDYDSEDFHQSWGTGASERSRYFSQQYGQSGEGYILSVNAGERSAEAESILEANGADLGRSSAQSPLTPLSGTTVLAEPDTMPDADRTTAVLSTGDSGYAEGGTDGAHARETGAGDAQNRRRIQLYGEVLRLHRDRLQRGEAPVRKETTTETQAPVSHEGLEDLRVASDNDDLRKAS